MSNNNTARAESSVLGIEGNERVQRETTAAEAQAEAPNPAVAHDVKENVVHAREAAEKAAQAAQGMGPEITGDTVTGLDVLRHEAEQRTNAAAAHGQQDIEKAKEVGAGYVEQAKSVAGNVITSANNTLRGSSEGKPRPQGSSTGTSAPGPSAGLGGVTTDVLTSLQTTASSAIGVTQQYLSSAQAVVQPHIDSAREKAQGYLGVGMRGSESDAVTPPERSSTNMISDAQGLPGSYPEPGARPSTTKVASSDPEH